MLVKNFRPEKDRFRGDRSPPQSGLAVSRNLVPKVSGISDCIFFELASLAQRSFRESHGNMGPILFWLHLNSKAEVDEIFAQ
jgi:hypothetical protein